MRFWPYLIFDIYQEPLPLVATTFNQTKVNLFAIHVAGGHKHVIGFWAKG